MNTLDQIDDFSAFAKSRLGSGEQADVDRLYDEWRSQTLVDIDALATQALIRGLENGERGESLDKILSDFEKERKQDKTSDSSGSHSPPAMKASTTRFHGRGRRAGDEGEKGASLESR